MKALITRSEPGASRMAEALSVAGLECVVRPMIAAEPTRQEMPGVLPSGAQPGAQPGAQRPHARQRRLPAAPDDKCFDHVIFVSEHAVAFGAEAVAALAGEARWYAIGPATAEALSQRTGRKIRQNPKTRQRDAGKPDALEILVPQPARSEGLLNEPGLLAEALADGGQNKSCAHSVLLVAGEDGRELIANTLEERGATVRTWLVYRRVQLNVDFAFDAGRNGAESIDVCVASSGAGLKLLTTAWFASGASASVPVCVPSPRIAKMAKALGWRTPVLCDGASAAAILKGLAGLPRFADLQKVNSTEN